ncbi:MAG: hypothetical protein DRJ03_17560 [Chloroflexi bacterium]|nr:MAG: hypothetical protein DRI81_08805 [Chloroflexota bacterium]RLC83310.1 MAG: hypothetical protein DRJ03_17560 [Chloroflexota bacterium]
MAGIKKLQVNWPGGLKLRAEPEPTNANYTGVKISHRTVVEAIGKPKQYDDQFSFQKVRTPEGREGWLTYRSGDTIYLTPLEIEPPPSKGKKLRVDWRRGLRMRAQPEPSQASFSGAIVPHGTVVTAIGEPFSHPEGYVFQRARTPSGRVGWLTRSYGDTVYLVEVKEETHEPAAETGKLWVDWFDGLKMRERPEPSLASFSGITVPYGAQVTAMGSPQEHAEGYMFQQVRLGDGGTGWLTLSYGDTVYLSKQKPDLTTKPIEVAQVSPVAGLWAEMRGSPGGEVQWWVGGAAPLRVLDPIGAGTKIGQVGQWIEVETPAFKRGFIGAQYLKPFTPSTHRTARAGESAYIYGIHDRYSRDLLKSAGATGWVLFTHAIGTDYQGAGGDRSTYYEWANDGFGVIARLNYGYGSSGTIPEPHQYNDFARTCAAFVERSIDPHNPKGGCHIWIIGNEMNNPREYPGNHDGAGGRPITPESYADCFNRAYRAIKRAYQDFPGLSPPDSIVVPGAIDPYNAVAGCNGNWFTRMLRRIDALDGIALHAYTHGAAPGLITSTQLFGQERHPPIRFPDKQLSWQYYHFYAYRTYMDLIPGKWRDAPVFITETDQVQKNWTNANSGWVKKMYAEVNDWNSNPNRQRVYCALLFRWETNEWQVRDKENVLQDFKEAAQRGYKWQI